MRYLIELAFNGKNYHGWQKQPNDKTVQSELEEKLSLFLGCNTEVTGCGRTDAGVHAKQFFAHFDSEKEIEPDFISNRLDKMLPHDISICEIKKVRDDFHARFDAVLRVYEYHIFRKSNPFLNEFAWFVHGELDVDAMNEAATLLISHKDFECFSKVHTDVKNFMCNVSFAKWEQVGKELIFTIKADRFLRNMVRAIVGTLIEVGRKEISLEDFKRILESKDRGEAGQSVPARGLFLTEVYY